MTETPRYCGWCGGEDHPACVARPDLSPPRFCVHCARRMVVQVTPTGWSASCSRHGARNSSGDQE